MHFDAQAYMISIRSSASHVVDIIWTTQYCTHQHQVVRIYVCPGPLGFRQRASKYVTVWVKSLNTLPSRGSLSIQYQEEGAWKRHINDAEYFTTINVTSPNPVDRAQQR